LRNRREKIDIFTLKRPESLNALSPTLFRELHDALKDFKENPELWVGMITGTGRRSYVLGQL
jgi:enoyl-CoA hydratase/carnithine racemase